MANSALLGQMRTELRRLDYSYRTEQAYTKWVIRFVKFHGLQHPENMDESEVEEYLNHLAEDRKVAASTHNQALSAILFLYSHVLERPLERMIGFSYSSSNSSGR